MTPYYTDGSVTIYHGDAREIVPQLDPVDVVLTDPPYGIEGGKGRGRERGKGDYGSDFEDTPEYIESIIVPVVRALIERVPCVVLTPGIRCMTKYPQPQSFGAFYQPAAAGLQVFGAVDAQPIYYYGKNASGRVMGVPCSYRLTESPEPNGHPCPKPIKAWRVLLSNISKQGQTVLDPFMGSGTTLRAAKDLGRKAIGIELEERWCEVAVRRLAQETLGLEDAA